MSFAMEIAFSSSDGPALLKLDKEHQRLVVGFDRCFPYPVEADAGLDRVLHHQLDQRRRHCRVQVQHVVG